jgi:LacI family transcriptional regulator
MRPTIKDIAKLAGVSTSTVSRSLNDSNLISEETKERIMKIAKELDFEFNASAQNLSKKKSDTICVIYPEEVDKPGIGGFLMEMLSEIRCSLEKESYYSIMTCPINSYTKKSNIRKLINTGNIDGLIIIHWDLDAEDLELIKNRKVPHIFLHHIPNNSVAKRSSIIVTDHFNGGKKATNHLLKLGHRNILCVSSYDNGVEFDLRIQGYKEALKEKNIDIDESRIVKGPHTFDFAYRYIKNNLNSLKDITAVFAQSDVMAFGVMKALLENGINVPDDISVIGYDGSEMGVLTYPGLTSIRQPIKGMVSEACNILIHDIDSNSKKDIKAVKRKLLPTLIKRDSCRTFKPK